MQHFSLLILCSLLFCGSNLTTFAQDAKKPTGVQPTEKAVKYGPHQRNVLNFWKVESDQPTGLLVNIHGGGWIGGQKHETMKESDLNQGWSVVSIDYPLNGKGGDILPSMVHSAARAIQFCRSKAKQWNIDPERIVVRGGSAGAASSMWLAFHDDMKNEKSDDPIERFSSRVAGAVGAGGQSTLDPFVIKEKIGIEGAKHGMIWRNVGAKSLEDLMENWDKFKELSLECSPLTHITKDDPPVYLTYGSDESTPAKNQGHGIHHPNFGKFVKEKYDALGLKCHLSYGKVKPKISVTDYLKSLLNK